MPRKKLYRSKKNKIIAGVIGGIGEYFDVDPVLLRLLWVLIVAFTGFIPGIIAYPFAIIIIPANNESQSVKPQPVAENPEGTKEQHRSEI